MTPKRQAAILNELGLCGSASIADLAGKLDVSEETVRRDLKLMSANGLVLRHHGGASLPDVMHEPAFQQRLMANRAVKERIAAKAAAMISNGDTIFLDIGSTTALVAHALKDHKDLQVITNSAFIANILISRNNNRVFMAGGELRDHDGGAFGLEAKTFLEKFNYHHAILSAGAIDSRNGFTCHYLCEAELYAGVIERADDVVICLDQSKHGRRAPVNLCPMDQVDMLVTDRTPPQEIVSAMTQAQLALTVA
ncbi:DeoR/GlpR family DNA-binding transcription regulator [Aestuariispira insulae]|nr:DeoR/GlpR family DNA-binding transcription regulator [Aestuariispira insulae]